MPIELFGADGFLQRVERVSINRFHGEISRRRWFGIPHLFASLLQNRERFLYPDNTGYARTCFAECRNPDNLSYGVEKRPSRIPVIYVDVRYNCASFDLASDSARQYLALTQRAPDSEHSFALNYRFLARFELC